MNTQIKPPIDLLRLVAQHGTDEQVEAFLNLYTQPTTDTEETPENRSLRPRMALNLRQQQRLKNRRKISCS